MSDASRNGLSSTGALRLEFGIIGLGIVALFMIFQPFSLLIFPIGCGLVVIAALANNLLPLAQPGTPTRSVVFAAVLVAMIFCSALIVAIFAAYLYGQFFLDPSSSVSLVRKSRPFWEHPFVWSLVTVDAVLILSVYLMAKKG